jgi:hypothetical protein
MMVSWPVTSLVWSVKISIVAPLCGPGPLIPPLIEHVAEMCEGQDVVEDAIVQVAKDHPADDRSEPAS